MNSDFLRPVNSAYEDYYGVEHSRVNQSRPLVGPVDIKLKTPH